MGVDPFEGAVGLERQTARHKLVEHDAQRIVVRMVVKVAVHPPRLLGRYVGERAFEFLRDIETLPLVAELGGDLEIEQLHLARRLVEEDILRGDILVDDVVRMDGSDCPHEADGHLEHGNERPGPRAAVAKKVRERPAERLGHDHRIAARVELEPADPDHAFGAAEPLEHLMLAPQPGDVRVARIGDVEGLDQRGGAGLAAHAEIEGGGEELLDPLPNIVSRYDRAHPPLIAWAGSALPEHSMQPASRPGKASRAGPERSAAADAAGAGA